MDRIHILEKETTPHDIQEKIILAYYSHQKKDYKFYTVDQVTDQLILKMIILIETSLNSAEQIQALEIIGNNFLHGSNITLKGEINDYVRAASFNRSFFPLSNAKIRNIGTRSFHIEILTKTYTEDLVPVYKSTITGERFFRIKATYFDENQVRNRITTPYGTKLIAKKEKSCIK